MFVYFLVPLKQIFKRIVKCELFFVVVKKMGNWPLLNVKKKYFLVDLFWACFDQEPNVDLSPNMYLLAQISLHAFFFALFVVLLAEIDLLSKKWEATYNT